MELFFFNKLKVKGKILTRVILTFSDINLHQQDTAEHQAHPIALKKIDQTKTVVLTVGNMICFPAS